MMKNTRAFLIFLHGFLIAYFWLANYYSINLKNNLPISFQTVIGILHLCILICTFATFTYLLTISRKQAHATISAFNFYWKVFTYYLIIISIPTITLTFQERLPGFAPSYLTFLFFCILINYSQYGIPSYVRFKKNTYK